jgi:hypothetical protein
MIIILERWRQWSDPSNLITVSHFMALEKGHEGSVLPRGRIGFGAKVCGSQQRVFWSGWLRFA